MSINKNFVVRNGFEASTNLILADANTRKVGIGTTAPKYTLHVNGGIGATDFYLTGIGTFANELNVGLGGTVLTVLGIGNSIGIGTAFPQYLLDIRSPVSTGQTALYVQGDVRITGDLSLDDVTLDDASIQDLTVTNTLIVAGLSTFNSNVFINAALNVSGITTLGSYVDINNSADISNNLNVVGLSTLGTVLINSGIITATSGIVTYYGSGQYLDLTDNPSTGIGIGTTGGVVGYGITFIDFYGIGVSFAPYNSSAGIATIFFEGEDQLNVIYVDTTNGDDTKEGHRPATAKKTIKAAVAAANAGDIIKVAPGVYQESLPIDITVSNLSIVGDSTRSVFVHPTAATETETMFRCNSGTYIEGFTFCGLKASGARGDNPIDNDPTYGLPEFQGWVAGFYSGCVLRKSPWIENCSNFADSGIDNNNFDPNNYQGTAGDITSSPTGGGVLVDGSLPDVTSPLRSFTINEFTQVCLDGPGLLVCNNGYAQAVSFFGLFCHYHAKALSGGQINMEVGTTNFGRYGVVADGKSATPIFTSTTNGVGIASDVTFAINAPVAAVDWFGDATRPAINMLVGIGTDIYPILSASPNGPGWNVTISRPNPIDRSENLGLINGHSDGDPVEFFLRSMVSTASHTMEYAGSGTDYTALPENGGVPNGTNEAVSRNDGRVWLTSTDQSGKFKVGDTFEVNQETGFVTIDATAIATNIVSDGTPQLGGDLDVLNRRIYTSLANNPIVIDANGTGSVQLKTASIERLRISTSQIGAGFSGTAAVPAYSFINDSDTGLLSAGPNELALSTGGTLRLTINSSGTVAVAGTLTQNGNNVFTTAGGTITGIATIATVDINAGEIDVTRIGTSNLNVSGISTFGNVRISSGIVTATSGIVTYYGDGQYLTNILSGVGISSLGTLIGIGATILNFIGTAVSTVTVSSGIATIKLDAGAGGGGSPGGTDGQVQYNNSGVFGGSPNFTFDGSNVNVIGIVTAVDFNSTSDKNLKYNVETVENALNTVNSLRGVSFNWKEDNRKSYGVIAQELAEVLPDLVSNGEIKTVNYNGIIGVLIEAVKELSAEVQELKSQLNN